MSKNLEDVEEDLQSLNIQEDANKRVNEQMASDGNTLNNITNSTFHSNYIDRSCIVTNN